MYSYKKEGDHYILLKDGKEILSTTSLDAFRAAIRLHGCVDELALQLVERNKDVRRFNDS